MRGNKHGHVCHDGTNVARGDGSIPLYLLCIPVHPPYLLLTCAQVLTIAGLENGQNVLVDGSMRNASWYLNYISDLRQQFPHLKVDDGQTSMHPPSYSRPDHTPPF